MMQQGCGVSVTGITCLNSSVSICNSSYGLNHSLVTARGHCFWIVWLQFSCVKFRGFWELGLKDMVKTRHCNHSPFPESELGFLTWRFNRFRN